MVAHGVVFEVDNIVHVVVIERTATTVLLHSSVVSPVWGMNAPFFFQKNKCGSTHAHV